MSLWSGPLTRIRRRRQQDREAVGRYYLGVQLGAEAERWVAEMKRVAAEQVHPRLWVGFDCPGRWAWLVTGPDACLLDSGHGDTWAEAIAVGLAALEVVSFQCPLCGLPIAACRDVNPPR